LVLVTHDRYMLDRISTVVLGFDGRGGTGQFANYLQWDAWQQHTQQASDAARDQKEAPRVRTDGAVNPAATVKKKLSYMEAREFATIEATIAAAEQELQAKRSALQDPSTLSDASRLQNICAELEQIENSVEKLYTRWAELDQKQS
jgi:ATP-binding cassette subfamily F protein uup